jgi:hypothetical protein
VLADSTGILAPQWFDTWLAAALAMEVPS